MEDAQRLWHYASRIASDWRFEKYRLFINYKNLLITLKHT